MPAQGSSNFKIFYALSLAWQLGFIIIFPLIGFILLGIFLDEVFSSAPLFLLAGAILGMVINFYELTHIFSVIIDKKND